MVVFVQGSGWREQQLGVNLLPLTEIARRGYVVALVEHRPSSVAAFPAQVVDVLTATRWLLDRATELRIDPERVALWGDSSGATPPRWSPSPGTTRPSPTSRNGPRCRSAASSTSTARPDLGAMDDEPTTTAHNADGSAESALLGGGVLPDLAELVRRADPRTHVSPDRPLAPMLIAHGTKDRLVPYAQSVLLYDTLRGARPAGGAGQGPRSGPRRPDLLDLVAEFLARNLRE